VLDVPVPPSVNRLRKLNRKGLAQLAKWQGVADKLVTAQWAGARLRGGCSRPSLTGQAVEVRIAISEKTRIDLDNAGKALLDYLCRIEVISDDRKRFVKRIVLEVVASEVAPEGVRMTVSPYR
jgi:hypothetical protein